MAQPNSLRKVNTAGTPTTPRGRVSPTFEQLMNGDASSWVSSPVTTIGKDHEHGEREDHHNKKSVLTKVKETAKKVKNSLSKKKHEHEDTGSPSLGVNFAKDDELEEDSEYLGAPMYESEMAPEPYKETARQHPRAIPVVSEKHVLLSSVKSEDEKEQEKPNKTITETVSHKLGPAYAAVSDATHAITSKIAGLTVAIDTGDDSAADSGMMKLGKGSETWDKGVSVKEYLMNKFEPGEDERALSQAITEAISPRRVTGDVGVVEKVKGAVNSLLHSDDSSSSSQSATRATPLAPPSPVSTNPQQKKEALTSLLRNDESSVQSARTVTGDLGVVEKVKGAVNSLLCGDDSSSSQSATRATPLTPPIHVSANPQQKKEALTSSLRNDESSIRSATRAANLSPPIPVSTNPYQVTEEENHGRILQAN